MAETNNKTIAKNTAFLYVRMLIIMVVTLYTSRVILLVLGVDDYGLYQTVGGVVVFLAFVSNALAAGTSRFITFSLDKGDEEELKRTFSVTFTTHILIGLVIVIIAESLGLWYVYNKMVIPEDRFVAALIVYQISILTALINLFSYPFTQRLLLMRRWLYLHTWVFSKRLVS